MFDKWWCFINFFLREEAKKISQTFKCFNSSLNCSVASSSASRFFATVRHHFAVTKYFLEKLSVMESSLKRQSVRCSFLQVSQQVIDSWWIRVQVVYFLQETLLYFSKENFIVMMTKIEVKSFRKHIFFAFLTLTWKWKIVSEREKLFWEMKMTERQMGVGKNKFKTNDLRFSLLSASRKRTTKRTEQTTS